MFTCMDVLPQNIIWKKIIFLIKINEKNVLNLGNNFKRGQPQNPQKISYTFFSFLFFDRCDYQTYLCVVRRNCIST